MKFAYLGYPHLGGTHSVFCQLRDGLRKKGINVRWLATKRETVEHLDVDKWRSEIEHGDLVGESNSTELQASEMMIRHLVDGGYAGVFINVLSSRLTTNACRFLPPSITRVMIVHSITRATYLAARAMRHYVDSTICVSPRAKSDLETWYGINPGSTFVVPNAYNHIFSGCKQRVEGTNKSLRVLMLGRVEDMAKGVFWAPKILAMGSRDKFSFTVAGEGRDLEELKMRCMRLQLNVTFTGRVTQEQAQELYLSHDVLLFPSRFEGLGITLVEAMVCGCVPVASRIRGVTDFVVEDRKTGYLFDVGNLTKAKKILDSLSSDYDERMRVSLAAMDQATKRFSPELMADAYHQILSNANARRTFSKTLSFDNWNFPREMNSGLRAYLPNSFKDWLRGFFSKYG